MDINKFMFELNTGLNENLFVYSYEYLDKNYNTILIRVMEV